MRRPALLSRLGTPVALAVVVTGLVTGLAATGPSALAAADPSPGSRAAATVTYTPGVTAAYVPNSLRGQYRWLSGGSQVAGYAAPDLYFRDSVAWSRIEPIRGSYDFGPIEDGLTYAAADGGRFGFRVMAWCPGCFTSDDPNKAWTKNEWVPTWVPKQSGDSLPDWNSATFLDAWDDLWEHLGAEYADDPRLGWIDVGGFGEFGEFHSRRGTDVTTANAQRLARAVLDNFPDSHVVVNAMKPSLTDALLAMSPRIGLRTDCLGAPDMYSLIATSAPDSPMATRWRTAPVLSEWCSANSGALSTTRGANQVKKFHVSHVGNGIAGTTYAALSPEQQAGFRQAVRDAGYRYAATKVVVPRSATRAASYNLGLTLTNSGSAPTYDRWEVVLQTKDSAGATVGEQVLPVSLTTLLSGSRTYTKSVTAPSRAGTYRLRLLVRDPRGYLAPMALANNARSATGSYPLGSLVVK